MVSVMEGAKEEVKAIPIATGADPSEEQSKIICTEILKVWQARHDDRL